MPKIKVQNLLSHHRQQLQSALNSLERALRCRLSSDSDTHQSAIKLEVSRSLSSIDPKQLDTLNSINNRSSQQANNIQHNGRNFPESLPLARSLHPQSRLETLSQSRIEEIKSEVKKFIEKLQKQSKEIHSFTNKEGHNAISQGKD